MNFEAYLPLLLLCIIYYVLGGIAIGLGLHRMLTHRSFTLPNWLAYPIITLSLPAGTPIQWAGNHRFHHAHTDGPKDPHSPHVSGFWFAHVGWYIGTKNPVLCIAYSLGGPLRMLFDSMWRPRTNQQYNYLSKDVARHSYYAWISKPIPYMLMMWLHAIAVFGLAYYLAGWFGFWIMWGLLAFLYNSCDAIDSVSHIIGTQPYRDRHYAKNHWIMGIIALGEGWHANHHAFPTSAKHGLLKHQFDWTWQIIKLLSYLGLATNVQLPSKSLIQARLGKTHA
jgi:fatty-acid desaturase